jgi:alcohol dehydrogenase (NADP+)
MKTTHTHDSEDSQKFKVKAYGASGSLVGGKHLEPMTIERHEPHMNEVLVEVLYCGVCHSDLHQVMNDWKNTIYPCVPGHEVVGRIKAIGSDVSGFQIGDLVGIGCMIDSCGQCSSCEGGEQQYCTGPVGPTMTYNGYMKPDGSGFNTYGGYSTHILADKEFILKIPESLDIKAAAPILCAGITTYAPLKNFGVKEGHHVAVVGIGGLGHMGVKIAKAMGAEVTAITSLEEKRPDARELGADHVIVSENKSEMEAAELKFDFILITIPYPFDLTPYIPMLNVHGKLVTVGLLGPYKKPLDNMEMAKYNRSVGGSMIGGIPWTQEVLDFCAEHGIQPDVQVIGIDEINDAFENLKNEEVRFRYVIDMQSLKDSDK